MTRFAANPFGSAQVSSAMVALKEAVIATIPGSVDSRSGRILKNFVELQVQEHFALLEKRFPMNRVLEFIRRKIKELRFEGDLDPLQVAKIADEVAIIIGPAIRSKESGLEDALATSGAFAYNSAAVQLEKDFAGELREAGLEVLGTISEIAPEIITWTRQNAARRVTRMTQTTQRDLANTIANAMRDRNRGVSSVAARIRERFDSMDASRARTIATTEMNHAMSTATHDRALSMGAQLKRWLTVGDDRVSETICAPNGGQGSIPVIRQFGSGHEHPPGHPNCRCALSFTGASRDRIREGLAETGRSRWLAAIGLTAGAALFVNAQLRNEEVPTA